MKSYTSPWIKLVNSLIWCLLYTSVPSVDFFRMKSSSLVPLLRPIRCPVPSLRRVSKYAFLSPIRHTRHACSTHQATILPAVSNLFFYTEVWSSHVPRPKTDYMAHVIFTYLTYKTAMIIINICTTSFPVSTLCIQSALSHYVSTLCIQSLFSDVLSPMRR